MEVFASFFTSLDFCGNNSRRYYWQEVSVGSPNPYECAPLATRLKKLILEDLFYHY